MRQRYLALAAFASLWLVVHSAAQPRRVMAPADILRVNGVSDAQISPNGQWVVYTVSVSDSDATRTTLWIARPGLDFISTPPTARPTPTPRRPTDQRPELDWTEVRRPPVQLLRPDWNASTPRWSPDSTMVAFLSNRDGQSGIWVVNVTKPDPRFVAQIQSTNFHIPYAGESYAWAPDSKRIAYVSATEEAEFDSTKKSDDPRVIDRIQYKSRTSFSDNRRTHIWIVDIDRPEPRQLASGLFNDHAVTFSPSGNEIAFLSNHEADPDANNNSDIFTVDLSGSVRQLTQTRGCEYEPAWSPDGRWIAYTATKRDVTTIDSIAEDAHVWVISADGGARNELTAEQDRRARNPKWSADSRQILFLAGDRGTTTIHRVGVSGGRIDKLSLLYDEDRLIGMLDPPASPSNAPRRFQIGSFSLSRGGVSVPDPAGTRRFTTLMAFTLTDWQHPAELWIWLGDADVRRLSVHNDGFVRSLRFSEPEEITFKSFDGVSVQGWLMKPAGFRDDRKFPLILSVHGGPHGMSGWGFNATFQAYAARGYGVLFLNPRGSSGYGQKFSDGTLGEWGGGDYRDLMTGVDEVLRRHSWINADRLGVTGGSYGGFMTNWIITQTPRFKAAVASASVSNLISFYATSLYQDLIHAEFGGFPWDNYELLWQWSPIRYVRQAQTPTLFIHGEQDNDVHITQAEEMYMALKRRGVETVFVRYPREGHGLREPRHRVDALERTLTWFDRFLK
ncbi:MAG TPA: S9 family peptidase [Pyrinomonadaceae bacterium]|nr:S9 family peptidase [Pyrinomonadaceae bacterium]